MKEAFTQRRPVPLVRPAPAIHWSHSFSEISNRMKRFLFLLFFVQLLTISYGWSQQPYLDTLNSHLSGCWQGVAEPLSSDPFGYPSGTFVNIPSDPPALQAQYPGVAEFMVKEHGYAEAVNMPSNTNVYVEGFYVWFGNSADGTSIVGAADQFQIKVYKQVGGNSFNLIGSAPFTLNDLTQPWDAPQDPDAFPPYGYSYPEANNFIKFPGLGQILNGFANNGDVLLYTIEVKTATSDDTLAVRCTFNPCATSWYILLGNNADASTLGWWQFNDFMNLYTAPDLDIYANIMIIPRLRYVPLISCYSPAITTTQSACGSATGTVAIELTGDGTPPVNYYLISAGDTVQKILLSDLTSATFNNVAAGTYDVYIVDSTASFCDTLVTNVVVPSATAPSINASANPTAICAGQTADLSASSNGSSPTFVWNPGNLNGANQTVSPSGTTTYTVTVTDGNNCTATATTTVTVNANPVPNISITNGATLPDTVILSAGVNGVTYQWYLDNTLIGSATQSTYTATSPGVYSVQVATPQGCTGSAQITLQPLSGIILCKGACTNLPDTTIANIPAGSTFVSWAPIQGIANPTQINVTACPFRNTTYTLTYLTPGGATATAVFDITVRPRPPGTITPQGPTTFCAGQTVVLAANLSNDPDCPDYGYRWLKDGILVAQSYPPATPGYNTLDVSTVPGLTDPSGVWTVVVDGCGCLRTSLPTYIDVIDPKLSVSSNKTICQPLGQDTICAYIGNANQYQSVSYNWAPAPVSLFTVNSGPGTNTYGQCAVVDPAATTTYTVTATVTAANGVTCSHSEQVTVTVLDQLPVPQISVQGETQQCIGGEVTLTANPCTNDFNYQWYKNGSPYPGGNACSITVHESGVYKLQITANGCNPQRSVDSVVVNFQALEVNITGQQEFCTGDSTLLTAELTPNLTTGVTYQWYQSGPAIPGATQKTVMITSSGPVWVVVNSTSCGTATDTLPIVETELNVSIGGPTTLCVGDTITLNATVVPSDIQPVFYQWAYIKNINGQDTLIGIPLGFGSQNQSIDVYYDNMLSIFGDRIVVRVLSPGCDTIYDTLQLNIINQIQATIAASTPGNSDQFCIGDNVTLTATYTPANLPNPTFAWRNLASATPDSIIGTGSTLAITASGNYEVTVGTSACSKTGVTNRNMVGTIPPVDSIIALGPTEFCFGGSVTLDGNAVAGATYAWVTVDPGGVVQGPATGVNTTEDYEAEVTGNYRRDVTLGGCIVNSNVITVTTSIPVNAVDSLFICLGNDAQLDATPGFTSYHWEPADLIVGSPDIRKAIAHPLVSTTFTVTATDVDGCETTDTVRVQVSPDFVMQDEFGICLGYNVPIQLTATNIPGAIYSWSPVLALSSAVIPNPMINPGLTSDVTYTLTVNDTIFGCTGSKTVKVRVVDLDTVSIISNTGGNVLCGSGASLTLTATSGAGFTYTWYRNTTEIVQGPNGEFVYTTDDTGDYTVKITGPGCGIVTRPGGVGFTVNQGNQATIDLGPTLSYCTGPGGQVQLNACVGGFEVWDWTPITGLPIDNTHICNPVASPGANGPIVYTVVATDTVGCTATDSVLVKPVDLDTVTVISATDVICQGTPLDMMTTAYAGLVYQWFKDGVAIPGAIEWHLPVTESGCYSVRISGPGCTPTMIEAKCVTVVAAPIVDAGPTRAVCPGGFTKFLPEVSNCINCTYLWTPDTYIPGQETLLQPTIQPASTIGSTGLVYTLTVTDPATGCTASDTARVRVVDVAALGVQVLTPNGTTFICENATLPLTASTGPGFYYRWQKLGNGFQNIVGAEGYDYFVYNAPTAGTYRVILEGSGVDACPATTTSNAKTLTSVPAPTASVTPNPTGVCPGGAVTLTGTASGGTGALTYAWTPDNTDIISGQGTLSLSLLPTMPRTYTFTATDVNNCKATVDVFVNYADLDTLVILPDGSTSLCEGDTVILGTNIGPGFDYVWLNCATNQIIPPGGPTLAVTTSGVYCLRANGSVGSACNAVQTQSITVTVSPRPNVELGPTRAICPGDTVHIMPQGTGIEYVYTPSTGLTVYNNFGRIAQPTETTTYTVTATGANGCTQTDELTVKVVSLDTVTIVLEGIVNGNQLCSGNTATLEASAGETGTDFTYVWKRNDVIVQSGTSYSYESTQPGTYTVTISGDNCTTATTPSIVIDTIPNAHISVADDTVSVCLGSTVNPTLNALVNAGSQPIVTWAWSPSTNLSSTNTQTTTVNLPAASTVYTVTAIAANGCSATATVTFRVVDLDTVTIQPVGPTSACQSEGALLIASDLDDDFTHQWFNGNVPISGATHHTYTAMQSGSYTVQISGPGCPTVVKGPVQVTINPAPIANVTTSGSTTLCEGESVTLSTTETPGITRQWQKDGVDIADATDVTLAVNTAGVYTVVLTNDFGCSTTSNSVTVTVNPIPDATTTLSTGSPTFCEGGSVTVCAVQQANVKYQWFKVPGNILQATTLCYTVTTTGRYVLVVTNTVTGCVNHSDTLLISGAATLLEWDQNQTYTLSPSSCTSDDGYIIASVKPRFPEEQFEFYINGAGPYINGFDFAEFSKVLDPDFPITPGYYHIVAKDAAGCEIDTVLTVSDNVDFSVVNVTVNPVSCTGNDGEVTIVVNGAPTGIPFEFSITGGAPWVPAMTTNGNTGASYTFVGLAPNNGYLIMIKRGECELTLNAPLEVPNGCCPGPISLKVPPATAFTQTTADIMWTNTGAVDYYELGVQPTSPQNAPWTTYQVSSSATSYSLSNLDPDVCYNVRLRSVCDEGAATSTWLTDNFCTPICGTPNSLTTTNTSFNDASIAWESGENAQTYEVGISPQGLDQWTTVTVNGNVFNYTFAQLTQAQCYDVRVRSMCIGGAVSSYLYDVFCTLDCPALTDVPTATATSESTITLSWPSVNTAQSYEVTYGPLNLPTQTVMVTPSGNPQTVTLSGLTPNTTYQVSVRVICSASISSAPIINVYATNAAVVECFAPENVQITGQTQTSLTVGWDAAQNAENYRVEWADNNSPDVSLGNATVAAGPYTIDNLTAGTSYVVRVVSICANGTATSDPNLTVGNTSPNITPCPTPDVPTFSAITTSTVTISWTPVAGASAYTVKYRKLGDASFEPDIMVDGATDTLALSALISATDYEVCISSTCADPNTIPSEFACAQFTTSIIEIFCQPANNVSEPFDITSNSATIFWDAVDGVNDYEIFIRKATSGLWGDPIPVIGQTSYIFVGLDPATNYQVQVRSDCFGGNNPTSDPIYTFFTTAPLSNCPTPEGLTTSNATTTSIAVSWNASNNAIGYSVEYKRLVDTDWTIATNSTTNTDFVVTGLEPSTDYRVRVRAICETGSVFSDPTSVNASTEASVNCLTPENFVSSNITDSSVDYTWDAVPGAVQYEFRYRIAGTDVWTLEIAATNSVTLTGLLANTGYEVTVRTACGAGDFSSTVADFFQTLQGCVPPSSISVNPAINSAIVSWNEVPGATKYVVSWRRADQQSFSQVTLTAPISAFAIQSLVQGTNYVVRIRTICGNLLTPYSDLVPFTTLVPRENATTTDLDETLKFTVYPNPSKGKFVLGFIGEANEEVFVRLYNAAGQLVYVQGYTANAGENHIEMELEEILTRGVYMLQLQQTKGSRSTKIIVH